MLAKTILVAGKLLGRFLIVAVVASESSTNFSFCFLNCFCNLFKKSLLSNCRPYSPIFL